VVPDIPAPLAGALEMAALGMRRHRQALALGVADAPADSGGEFLLTRSTRGGRA
jgi:hypothetical protein